VHQLVIKEGSVLLMHGVTMKFDVIKLFGPNYLINGSAGYSFWPRGLVKKLLKH